MNNTQQKRPEDCGTPDMGETFYYIEECGNIIEMFWWNSKIERDLLACGNCFVDVEDARKALEARKAFYIELYG